MSNIGDFFDKPATRQTLALIGVFLAIMGLVIMAQAHHESVKDVMAHSTKLVNMIVPNWPWRNYAGELIMPWMEHSSKGIRIYCQHGGLYVGLGQKKWTWQDDSGNWKWPWN